MRSLTLLVSSALLLSSLTVMPATAQPPPPPSEPVLTTVPVLKTVPGRSTRLDPGAPAKAPAVLAKRFAAAKTAALTLRHLDRTGTLSPGAETAIASLDGIVNEPVDVGTGEVTVELPLGRYVLVSVVPTGTTASVLVQPLLELGAASTVVLDARQAKPFDVTVADHAVASSFAALYFSRRADDGSQIQFQLPAETITDVFAAQTGPAVPAGELTSSVMTQWAVPGKAGDFTGTPITYNTMNTIRGTFFTGLQRVVQPKTLVPLEARLFTTGPGLSTTKSVHLLAPEMYSSWGKGYGGPGPRTVTEYVEPGAEVLESFQEREEGPDALLVTAQDDRATRTISPGRTYTTPWNKGVLGPFVTESAAMRYGDFFGVGIGMSNDSAGHTGWGQDTAAVTRLYRDGVLVVEADRAGDLGRDAQVEPGLASYRLESEVVRNAAARRSTQVKASWTFRSDTASEDGERLPLWSIGFRPAVDATNDVRRTAITKLPFTVTPQPGATVGKVGKPVVELSGDRGKTWQRATVVTQRNGFVAVAATPPGATISLRANATDSAGNTIEQTVVDAYGLR
ncbi:hypothetical protein GCM10027269_29030 [Kribbella endophytica]